MSAETAMAVILRWYARHRLHWSCKLRLQDHLIPYPCQFDTSAQGIHPSCSHYHVNEDNQGCTFLLAPALNHPTTQLYIDQRHHQWYASSRSSHARHTSYTPKRLSMDIAEFIPRMRPAVRRKIDDEHSTVRQWGQLSTFLSTCQSPGKPTHC